jgi:hypothetical protein
MRLTTVVKKAVAIPMATPRCTLSKEELQFVISVFVG